MKHIVFAMLALSVFVSGDLCAANGSNPVVVDGHRLSVHAKGMALGELLIAIEEKTGIQFRFDELVARKEIFLDFEGLLLSEGIKQIIHPLSWAMIYDVTGKLRKVIILERWKGSGMDIPRQGKNDSPDGPTREQLDSIHFTPKGSSESFRPSKGSPPGKRPIYSDDSPVDKAHSRGGSPHTQDEMPEDLPVPRVGGSGRVPIPDSKGAVMAGPPVDSVPLKGGSPNTQAEIVENLPVPAVRRSGHLPIPNYEGLY